MPRKNVPERNKTTIWVDKETRDKLNTLKIIPEEHLDSVINRLINKYGSDKIE